MLEQRVIKPLQTKWATAIEFAPEKNATFRFYIYREKINDETKRDIYSIQ